MPLYSERLASFTEWPHALPRPENLAKAGFSHRPTSEKPDNVICKICKDCLCDWEPEDDPELELYIHHYRCLCLWLVLETTLRKMPSTENIGFFDLLLQFDFPELCLFQDSYVFCNRIKRCRFTKTNILALLSSCLHGEALK